ncbi:HIT family protein [Streptomyces sp. NPDC020983]|uniref:HIT family protein n=1 Tax=Streptomyces sp. NPDC020983 TaxID=3365106 RepID=UPI0037A00003
MTTDPCPFCEIVAGRAPATVVAEWPEALAIEPLNPVTRGHLLVIPRQHVRDFVENPQVSAATMLCAAEFLTGMGSYNLITSKGRPATQSVFHLHLHLIPRAEDDGLALPWYSGKSSKPRER